MTSQRYRPRPYFFNKVNSKHVFAITHNGKCNKIWLLGMITKPYKDLAFSLV